MVRAVSTEEILLGHIECSFPIGKDYSVLQENFACIYSFHHVVQPSTLGLDSNKVCTLMHTCFSTSVLIDLYDDMRVSRVIIRVPPLSNAETLVFKVVT